MSQAGSYTGGGSPAADLETLTGNNVGFPVGPDAEFNINIIGTNGLIVTGTPLDNTLTISHATSTFVKTLTGNNNDMPVGPDVNDNINIIGAGGIVVTGDPMTNTLTITGPGSMGGNEIKITKFTANGTFTKDPRSLYISVLLWNGGSGGGSGRQGTSAASSGGGGGAGGAFLYITFPSILFADNENVIIGQGGAGGASQLGASTDGNIGDVGGESFLGNISAFPFVFDAGVSNFITGAGRGGSTMTVSGGTGQELSGDIAYTSLSTGNAGAPGSLVSPGPASSPGIGGTTTGYSNIVQYVCAGGGGGSGADVAMAHVGGTGGSIVQFGYYGNQPASGIIYPGGAGGIEGGLINGSDGLDFVSDMGGRVMGSTGGGGGGGQSTGLAAGDGGQGGIPSGGGGGGGGSLNGTPSGAGGDGGRGEVWTIETLGTLTMG